MMRRIQRFLRRLLIGPDQPITINVEMKIDAEGIAVKGVSGRNGEQVIVSHIQRARLRGQSV
jgi:hypothetical protein